MPILRRVLVILFFVCLQLRLSLTMRVEPIPLPKEGQGIIELERGSTKAELAKDRVWFEEHFADEYVSFMATQLW